VSAIGFAIETEGLTKVYRTGLRGTQVGLEDLTLNVREGTIFGLLGPNGSGKTTTLNLLLGLIFPTSGTGKVLGHPLGSSEYKARVGFLPDGSYFYDHLNADELLSFYGTLFGMSGKELHKRIDELLDMMDMVARRKTRIREYSKGMAQRIGVAQALLNDPDLVFLDEPTTGLDPIGAKQMRDVIVNLRAQGKTVFLCSHLLKEMEALCDEIGILHNGRLISQGTLDELLHEAEKYTITARNVPPELRDALQGTVEQLTEAEGELEVRVTQQQQATKIVEELTAAGAELVACVQGRRSLEDYFIETVRSETGGEGRP